MGEHMEKMEKVLKILRKDFKELWESFWKNFVKISCNSQENLKKLEGIQRKYAIIESVGTKRWWSPKNAFVGNRKKFFFTWNKWHTGSKIEHSAASQCRIDVPGAGIRKNATDKPVRKNWWLRT